MSITPIEFDSPLFPLPPDYYDLTHEGQRQARVNGCRQWLLPGGQTQRAERLVASTWLFDSYYLQPDRACDFDPMFYDEEPLPTPEMHWEMSRMWGRYRMNIVVAPRGSAKSTHNRRDIALRLVSSAAYSFVYATSTHDNAKHTGQILRDQCYENERIQDDWGSEYRAPRLKPSRGEKPTGVEYFYLNNGSWIRCVSAESRLRGLRPKRFRLDDPEYDAKMSTSMQQVQIYMDNLLFRISIPMVLRRGAGIDWTATYVSPRHYAWHAMQVMHTPDGDRAVDGRFNHWARLFIPAAATDPGTGKLVSCWPEMWPETEEAAEKAGLHDSISLEKMEEIMGADSFAREMMGRMSSRDSFFDFDHDPEGRNAYWYENVDPIFRQNPRMSDTLICWKDQSGTTLRVPVRQFLRETRQFITVDTAYTERATSDRRCCTLMAVTRDNELFVLDMWSDQKGDSVLVSKTFGMAERWRTPTIHVEVVKDSFKLYKRFQSLVATKAAEDMGYTHIPGIKDMRPGTMTKTAKIETLDVRFEHGLIKLPIWKLGSEPWWTRFFDQVEQFNPDAEDGGLQKDDEIDTVAMSLFVIRGRVRKWVEQLHEEPKPDPLAELAKGNTHIPGTDVPYASGLPFELLPEELIAHILNESPSSLQGSEGRTRV